MRRSLEDEALQKGLAASDASLHLSSALRPVTEQILAAGRGEAEWPSEAQLEEVRRRYVVYKALDDDQAKTWSAIRDNPYSEMLGYVALAVYRLTVFAAACVVVWRYLMS
jgi:hypothetical protein